MRTNEMETITVRKSQSIVNRFSIFIEHNKSRARIASDLSLETATKLAREKAELLAIPLKLFTLHADLETVQINGGN